MNLRNAEVHVSMLRIFLFWLGTKLNCALELSCNWKFVLLFDKWVRGSRIAKSINWFRHIFFLILCGICKDMAVDIGSANWNCIVLRFIPSAGMELSNWTWFDPSWFRESSSSDDADSSEESSASNCICWAPCIGIVGRVQLFGPCVACRLVM